MEFSGGYVSSRDFSGHSVFVGNNFLDSFDAVQVSNDGQEFIVQVNNFEDLDSLLTDSLPVAGTAFESAPEQIGGGNFQLEYSDDFGQIFYDVSMANNTTFVAKGVPEPSTIALLCGVAICCLSRRKRR